MGDGVRVAAIRRFFEEQNVDFREFALTRVKPRVDILHKVMSPAGLKNLARKLLVDRSHSLLKELGWRIEAEGWEATIDESIGELRDSVGDISIFQGETLFGGMVCLKLKELTGKSF